MENLECEMIKEEGGSGVESYTEKHNNINRHSELSEEQFCSQDLAGYLHTQGISNHFGVNQSNYSQIQK